jgi:hypothetical protein
MTAFCRTFPVSGAVAVAAVLLFSGCMKDLPAAPSELTSGVTIYEHADFAGASSLVTGDLGDLKDFHGPCPGEIITPPTPPAGTPTGTIACRR